MHDTGVSGGRNRTDPRAEEGFSPSIHYCRRRSGGGRAFQVANGRMFASLLEQERSAASDQEFRIAAREVSSRQNAHPCEPGERLIDSEDRLYADSFTMIRK